MAELTSKASVTAPMRALISIFYPPERLAASSANKGSNSTIRTANFGKDTHAGAPSCFTSCISQQAVLFPPTYQLTTRVVLTHSCMYTNITISVDTYYQLSLMQIIAYSNIRVALSTSSKEISPINVVKSAENSLNRTSGIRTTPTA